MKSNSNEDYFSVEQCYSFKGSPYWIAPEVVKKEGHGFPADIWSVGCVAIELLTGYPPFYENKNVKEVLEIIKSGSYKCFGLFNYRNTIVSEEYFNRVQRVFKFMLISGSR